MTPLDNRIDEDFVGRFYRGEPIVLEGQLEDKDGAVESLDGRTFWCCIMAADGTILHEVVADIIPEGEHQIYRGTFDGAVTDNCFGRSGLIWSKGEHVEALGRRIHSQGPLVIYPGPGSQVPAGSNGIAAIAYRTIRRETASGRAMVRISQQGARGPSPWEVANLTQEQYRAGISSEVLANVQGQANAAIEAALIATQGAIAEQEATEAARIQLQGEAADILAAGQNAPLDANRAESARDEAEVFAAAALDTLRSYNPFAPQSEADHVTAAARVYGVAAPYANALSIARGSSRMAMSVANVATEFAPNALARTDAGLALAPAVQNSLPDAWMTSGAAGIAPDGMSFTATASGITAEVVGKGTQFGLPYTDVRWFGTAASGGSGQAYFASNGQIPTAQNDEWALWAPIVQVGAPAGGTTGFMRLAMLTTNAAYTNRTPQLDGGTASSEVYPDHVEADPLRWTIPQADAAFLRPYAYFGIGIGQAIDVTFRFFPATLVKGGGSAAFPIRTTGVAGVIADDATYPNVAPNPTSAGSAAPSTLPTSWTQQANPAVGLTREVVPPLTVDGKTYAGIRFRGVATGNQAHVLYFGTLAPAGAPITGQTWLLAAEVFVADVSAVAPMRGLQLALAERASGSDLQTTLKSVKATIGTSPKTFSVSRKVTEATSTNVRGAIYFQTTDAVAVDITVYFRTITIKNVTVAPQPVGAVVQANDALITVAAPAMNPPYAVGLWMRSGTDPLIGGVLWRSDNGQDSIELTRDAQRQAHLIFRRAGVVVRDFDLGAWADRHVIKVAAKIGLSEVEVWRSGRAIQSAVLANVPTAVRGLVGTPASAVTLLRQASYAGVISDDTAADFVSAPQRRWHWYGDSLTEYYSDLGRGPRYDAVPGLSRRRLKRPTRNAGIAGQTSTQIVDRLVADPLIGPGDVVVLGAGQNNITQFATITADIARAKAYCDSKGATLIYWAPITPSNSTPGSAALINRDTIEANAIAQLGADHVALVQAALVNHALNDDTSKANLTFGVALRADPAGNDKLHLNLPANVTVEAVNYAVAAALGQGEPA